MTHTLLAATLLALAQGVAAQQPPTGGALVVPPAPPLRRAMPEIRVEQPATPRPADAADARIAVRHLRLTGAHMFGEPELVAVAGFVPGSELSLAELQQMAARITAHYRAAGYFVAQAWLPAQEIRDEAVTIAVSEGRLGSIQLRNQTNLSDHVAQGALRGLREGDVIAAEPLESRLLLLSDLPGVSTRSTLVPGTVVGTSDLIVDVLPGRRVTGSIDADNGGNRYTGAWRVGATVNVNNPAGLADVASLRLLTSGSGLRYARLSYQVQAGRGQVGVAYSRLDYRLGEEFSGLRAHGTADIASVFGRYPLVRSRNDNVHLQLAFDARRFDDRVDSTGSATERQSRVLMASVVGDHGDGFGGGGATSYSATWTTGQLDLRTPEARAQDAATARSNGHYDKLSATLQRVQRLGSGPFSVYAGASGQVAANNLDVSEKMSLGGMNGVRAFPEGEAYADEGLLLTLEGRMDLPPPAALPGSLQLVAFVDSGTVRASHRPWAPGDNSRSLHGAGVGINWAQSGNFLVRAFYARRLGDERALSAPDASGRFWIQLVKYL